MTSDPDSQSPTPLPSALQRKHTAAARRILEIAYSAQGKPFTWTDDDVTEFNVHMNALAAEVMARRPKS